MGLLLIKLILLSFLIVPKSLTDDINIKYSIPDINYEDKFKVFFLEPNKTFNFIPSKRGFFTNRFNTYCYRGEPKTLGRLLESIELRLEISGNEYTQYEGATHREVKVRYLERRHSYSLNFFSQKISRISLSPFDQQCIGIETAQAYNITIFRTKVDNYRSIQLMSGIIIFLFAGVLSSHSLFYYIFGILFGVCTSFLLLIWLSGKLMPKRTVMYGVLLGGWTLGVYVISKLWSNLQMIIMIYSNYVCCYIIITGIISFFVCYRWGPPQNPRSKNIIKWVLQLLSMGLIYFSSNFKEATTSIILATIIVYYFRNILIRITCSGIISSEQYLNPSALDISLSEDDCTNQKLYSLPDGSYILSKNPPLIITPQNGTPVQRRSDTFLSNDDQNDGDYTPKNHHSHMPLADHSRRLTDTVATSDLSLERRLGVPSSSQLSRSSSVQLVSSFTDNMISSPQKQHASNPDI